MDDLSAINLDMPPEQLLKNENHQEKSPQLTVEAIPMERNMHIPEGTRTENLLGIAAVIGKVIEMENEWATDQDIESVKETVIALVTVSDIEKGGGELEAVLTLIDIMFISVGTLDQLEKDDTGKSKLKF